MSTNMIYTKSVLLVRLQNRYLGTMYMSIVSGLLTIIDALLNSK